jgi:hypothetical protein
MSSTDRHKIIEMTKKIKLPATIKSKRISPNLLNRPKRTLSTFTRMTLTPRKKAAIPISNAIRIDNESRSI